jgi:large subunit ribosomal protein L9
MYGSIASSDIVEALKEESIEIDKNLIMLDEPLKSLGVYEVSLALPGGVLGKVKVWIVKK